MQAEFDEPWPQLKPQVPHVEPVQLPLQLVTVYFFVPLHNVQEEQFAFAGQELNPEHVGDLSEGILYLRPHSE